MDTNKASNLHCYKWSLMIKNRYGCQCIVHMHITADLKAFLGLLIYAVMWSLYVDYSNSAVVDRHPVWQVYLLRGICK